MPPVQVQPAQSVQTASGMPMVQQVQAAPVQKTKDMTSLIKTIVIIAVSLIAVTFIGLFIMMLMQRNEAQNDVDGQISVAVAEALDDQAAKLEAEYLENMKYPYKTFFGPVDYGELNFEYPKTWNLYIAKDASNGGDYEAYFNPDQVEPISNETVMAVRLSILDDAFEKVAAEYERYLEDEEAPLKVEAVTVNDGPANLYTGVVPETDFSGMVLLVKIRDKTAVLRTDSMLFESDFRKLMDTIKFNT